MNLLRFGADTSEEDLRRALVEAGQLAYARGLMVANDGNLSVRLGVDHILITPSGLCKGRLSPGDMLTLDLEGQVLKPATDPRLKPSSETPMHLEVYRRRPDVRAVIHAHPTFATALTVTGRPFPADVLPEVLLTLGEIPVTAYATPSSHEDAEAIRELVGEHNAILLRQHGSLTVGAHLDEALIALERLEHAAQVIVLAELLGNVNRLEPEAVERLRAMRTHYLRSRRVTDPSQGGSVAGNSE